MSGAYLVQYGRSAFVGRFRPPEQAAWGFATRGTRVVIQGPRGLEVGTVLCEPADRFAQSVDDDGEIVRVAAAADETTAERNEALCHDILAAADEAALPVSFVDAEVSLDGRTAILHAIPWGECDATPLLAEMSDRYGLAVRLLDLSRTPMPSDPPEPSKAGCGKPGCGSESGGCSSCGSESGGGCSTGSCSRGQVKSADALTAYFANLRQQMEAATPGRTPLA